MGNKINIAELLKDCPMGMELDCVMYDNLYFKCIREHPIYPIVCYTIDSKGEKNEISFNWYGKHTPIDTAKCVIFPKGKTTWEGFVPPCQFKDGDIIYNQCIRATAIFYKQTNDNTISHCFLNVFKDLKIQHKHSKLLNDWRLATEEEKQKLFEAIKAHGYKWNSESKTLEKLVEPKFKVGDVVISVFGDIHLLRTEDSSYCAYRHKRKNKLDNIITTNITVVRLATEEEKAKLFQAIKDNGYKWNAETKTLERLIELKFKVGDKIKPISLDRHYIIKNIKFDRYILNNNHFLRFNDEHNFELVPNKFDITTLKPFDKVLVRDNLNEKWNIHFFSYIDDAKMFKTIMGTYIQCIPYEGNEHLLGKTEDCKDFYRTW